MFRKVSREETFSRQASARSHKSVFNVSNLPEVAVVGYSNCGKSSLVNALCGAEYPDNDAKFSFASVSARVSSAENR